MAAFLGVMAGFGSLVVFTFSVFLKPVGAEFGWSREAVSSAFGFAAISVAVASPKLGHLLDRLGPRRVIIPCYAIYGLALCSLALLTSHIAQFYATFAIIGLVGNATTQMGYSRAVSTWFDARRGTVLGALSAANATGQLVFLPLLAGMVERHGWRAAALVVSGAAAIVFAVVLVFMRDRPEDLGLLPYGRATGDVTPRMRPMAPVEALRYAARSRAFWILAGTFFVCGASTNGLIGTHLIAACHDYGIAEVRSARLLAMMGIFDIIGTTASGWLTDRIDPRKLLFAYYGLRGLSLIYLPFANFTFFGLSLFAVFYGLDWIATVPPTLAVANRTFGIKKAPILFGWISASHQIGAASAAFFAGASRTGTGSYLQSFVIAGFVAVAAAFLALMIGTKRQEAAPAAA